MATSDDSRAFTVLKQNAEDFKASFDEDVTQCLAILDSKITELLRDQESLSSSYADARRLNAHMEFSKAKLGIFVSMKDLLNEMENSWAQQLSELKQAFVENIEIFLAGTKLEVKEDCLSPFAIKKGVSALKVRKSFQSSTSLTVSSLYPSLFDTAKHIPGFDTTPQIVKPIRKLPTSPIIKDSPVQNARRKNSVRFMEVEQTERIEVEQEEMEEDIEEIAVVEAPVQKRRGRKPAVTTPASAKKTPAVVALQDEVVENVIAAVGTPIRSGRGVRKSVLNTPTSLKKGQAATPQRRRNAAEAREVSSDSSSNSVDKTVGTPQRRRNAVEVRKESSESSSSSDDKPETQAAVPKSKHTRRGATALLMEAAMNVTPDRQKRKPAKRTAANQAASESETSESDTNKKQSPVAPRTPKNVHFSLGLDLNEDLDIYSPEIDLTRSAPRRKTTVNPVMNTLPDLFLTPDVVRSKSKRKTIADISEMAVAPSPKRLKKTGSRSSIVPSMLASEVHETEESDLLDSDEASDNGNYTSWIPLSDVGAKVPAQPGVYELKVSQAKKPAYIGSCESLRQKLTLHKLKHNSGHKHLDKFVERNAVNILVRFEKTSDISEAKLKEKTRVKSFVSQFNTTPAYN